MGSRAFCPVSGVVFTVTQASPHRALGGSRVYFCCAPCAAFFSANEAEVRAARGI